MIVSWSYFVFEVYLSGKQVAIFNALFEGSFRKRKSILFCSESKVQVLIFMCSLTPETWALNSGWIKSFS